MKALARILPPLNRWFMIPALRHGLGAWIGTPIGGYIALLRVRGRRTGRIRETPLTYLIADGSAWVMAGFGTRTQWYANLLADPIVEVVLPGRTVRARASEAGGPAERSAILPRLVRAAGAPGLLVGCVPWTSPDEQILALLEGVPLVRLTPLEGRLIPGPDDPGGTAWLPRQALMGLVALGLVRVLRGRPDQPRAASRP